MILAAWWFRAKAWLGGAGLVVGIVGMALKQRLLVGVAVGMLALAFLARFGERPR